MKAIVYILRYAHLRLYAYIPRTYSLSWVKYNITHSYEYLTKCILTLIVMQYYLVIYSNIYQTL